MTTPVSSAYPLDIRLQQDENPDRKILGAPHASSAFQESPYPNFISIPNHQQSTLTTSESRVDSPISSMSRSDQSNSQLQPIAGNMMFPPPLSTPPQVHRYPDQSQSPYNPDQGLISPISIRPENLANSSINNSPSNDSTSSAPYPTAPWMFSVDEFSMSPAPSPVAKSGARSQNFFTHLGSHSSKLSRSPLNSETDDLNYSSDTNSLASHDEGLIEASVSKLPPTHTPPTYRGPKSWSSTTPSKEPILISPGIKSPERMNQTISISPPPANFNETGFEIKNNNEVTYSNTIFSPLKLEIEPQTSPIKSEIQYHSTPDKHKRDDVMEFVQNVLENEDQYDNNIESPESSSNNEGIPSDSKQNDNASMFVSNEVPPTNEYVQEDTVPVKEYTPSNSEGYQEQEISTISAEPAYVMDPSQWEHYYTEEGYSYYYNAYENRSMWEEDFFRAISEVSYDIPYEESTYESNTYDTSAANYEPSNDQQPNNANESYQSEFYEQSTPHWTQPVDTPQDRTPYSTYNDRLSSGQSSINVSDVSEEDIGNSSSIPEPYPESEKVIPSIAIPPRSTFGYPQTQTEEVKDNISADDSSLKPNEASDAMDTHPDTSMSDDSTRNPKRHLEVWSTFVHQAMNKGYEGDFDNSPPRRKSPLISLEDYKPRSPVPRIIRKKRSPNSQTPVPQELKYSHWSEVKKRPNPIVMSQDPMRLVEGASEEDDVIEEEIFNPDAFSYETSNANSVMDEEIIPTDNVDEQLTEEFRPPEIVPIPQPIKFMTPPPIHIESSSQREETKSVDSGSPASSPYSNDNRKGLPPGLPPRQPSRGQRPPMPISTSHSLSSTPQLDPFLAHQHYTIKPIEEKSNYQMAIMSEEMAPFRNSLTPIKYTQMKTSFENEGDLLSPDDLSELLFESILQTDVKTVTSLVYSELVYIDCVDSLVRTPVHYACYSSNDEILMLLLDSNARGDAADIQGNRPIHIAAVRDNAAAIVALITLFAHDVNVQNDLGNTPLHLALLYGNPTAVEALLDIGCNPLLRNNQGYTPLEFVQNSTPPTPFKSYEVYADALSKVSNFIVSNKKILASIANHTLQQTFQRDLKEMVEHTARMLHVSIDGEETDMLSSAIREIYQTQQVSSSRNHSPRSAIKTASDTFEDEGIPRQITPQNSWWWDKTLGRVITYWIGDDEPSGGSNTLIDTTTTTAGPPSSTDSDSSARRNSISTHTEDMFDHHM